MSDGEKLKKYKDALKILLNDSIIDKIKYNKETNNINEDNYKIVDKVHDLEMLDKKEYDIIKKQDDYVNYNKITTYIKKGSMLYGIVNTVVGIGSLLFLF